MGREQQEQEGEEEEPLDGCLTNNMDVNKATLARGQAAESRQLDWKPPKPIRSRPQGILSQSALLLIKRRSKRFFLFPLAGNIPAYLSAGDAHIADT